MVAIEPEICEPTSVANLIDDVLPDTSS